MSSSNFLKLPVEIRLTIYEHVLVADIAIEIVFDAIVNHTKSIDPGRFLRRIAIWRTYDKRPRLFTNILTVCKTIFKEASPVLYSRNVFLFGDLGPLGLRFGDFIQMTGSQGKCLRHIATSNGALAYGGRIIDKSLVDFELFSAAGVGVKIVEIYFHMHWKIPPFSTAETLRLFEDIDDRIRSLHTVEKIIIGPNLVWRLWCRSHPEQPTFEATLEPELREKVLELAWTIAD
jgi:hypothetical protein